MNEVVIVNEESKEPSEYFKVLKGSVTYIDEEKLQTTLNNIARHIIHAKEIGQDAFLRKLAFLGDTLLKEQIVAAAGFRKYVQINDIKNYIDKVQPKNSVKIIELNRYPRAIPLECMEDIKKAKSLNCFNRFSVVFTDFSEQGYKTEEEKKLVARNRDPIVFGHFLDEQTGYKHERFYLITDWEDEFCDLTFEKLIATSHIQVKEITDDSSYIRELVGKTLVETTDQKKGMFDHIEVKELEPKSFWQRLWKK